MKPVCTIGLLVLGLTLAFASEANLCKEQAGPGEDLTENSPLLSGLISVCDLEADFRGNRFPRLYTLLDQGLAQQENGPAFLESALSMANDLATSAALPKAEVLYQIMLKYHPQEPRVLSSYAAISVLQQNYARATELIHSAVQEDPSDPVILGNAFLLSLIDGNYAAAKTINQYQIKTEPQVFQHVIRGALLDVYSAAEFPGQRWEAFVNKFEDASNRAYWQQVGAAIEQFAPDQLIGIANGLIDSNYAFEAIILLDYVNRNSEHMTAYYVKARALEQSRHYKPAFSEIIKANNVYLAQPDHDTEFYQGFMFNLGRLAYAARDFDASLKIFDDFKSRGFVHQHLDYMFAVNLLAQGKQSEAGPYLQKCLTQGLAQDLHQYCQQQLAQFSAVPEKDDSEPIKTGIRISNEVPTPVDYLNGTMEQVAISWLGKITAQKITESEAQITFSWTAEYIHPVKAYDIENGDSYDIEIDASKGRQYFQVIFHLNPETPQQASEIRERFTPDETFILVRGDAVGVLPLPDSLAAQVHTEQAIFTSDLKLLDAK